MPPATARDAREAFSAVFVDDVQPADFLPVCQPVLDKIIAPNVIFVLRTQTDTTAVIQPKPPSFRLFLRDFETLFTPYTLYTLMIDAPSLLSSNPLTKRYPGLNLLPAFSAGHFLSQAP